MRLKFRLPLVIAVLIIISVVGLGFLSYNKGSQIILENEGKLFKRILKDYQVATNLIVDSEKQLVDNMAKRHDFVEVINQSLEYENFMDFKHNEAELIDKVRIQLRKINEDKENIDQIFLVDRNGKVVLDSIGNAIEQDFTKSSSLLYFYDLQKAQEPLVSEPMISMNTGKSVMHFATSIHDLQSNTVVGFLINAVYTDSFFTEMRKEQFGESGFIYVVDKDGTFLTHKDEEKIGQVLQNEVTKEFVIGMRTGVVYEEPILDTYNNGEITYSYIQIPKLDWLVVAETQTQEFLQGLNDLRKNSINFGVIIALFAILIGIGLSRAITKPLAKLQAVMGTVAQGKLQTTDIKRKDEIGDLANSFNEMVTKQKELIEHINRTGTELNGASSSLNNISQQVLSSAEQVATSIDQVASGIGDNAKDVELTSNALYEVGEKVNGVVDLVNRMKTESMEITNLNKEGANIVGNLETTNNTSITVTKEIAHDINELNTKSTQIGNIVVTIDAISEQTNLLALNAAIEAARAGESGRGFAVVADEIRKLAEQSAQSTGEINKIINLIQQEIEQIVDKMAEVGQAVEQETIVVKDARVIFEKINSGIENIIQEISRVSEAMESVVKSKDDVLGYMNNVSAVTEEVSASSEEIAAASEQQTASISEVAQAAHVLKKLAEELQEVLGYFISNQENGKIDNLADQKEEDLEEHEEDDKVVETENNSAIEDDDLVLEEVNIEELDEIKDDELGEDKKNNL